MVTLEAVVALVPVSIRVLNIVLMGVLICQWTKNYLFITHYGSWLAYDSGKQIGK